MFSPPLGPRLAPFWPPRERKEASDGRQHRTPEGADKEVPRTAAVCHSQNAECAAGGAQPPPSRAPRAPSPAGKVRRHSRGRALRGLVQSAAREFGSNGIHVLHFRHRRCRAQRATAGSRRPAQPPPRAQRDRQGLHRRARPAPQRVVARGRSPALRRVVPSPLPRISAFFGNGAINMTSPRSVVFANPARTAIGTFGGSLKQIATPNLRPAAIKSPIAPPALKPDEVGTVAMGNVIQAGIKMNPARQA